MGIIPRNEFWSINSHDYTAVSNWFQCPRIGFWGNLQETTTFLGKNAHDSTVDCPSNHPNDTYMESYFNVFLGDEILEIPSIPIGLLQKMDPFSDSMDKSHPSLLNTNILWSRWCGISLHAPCNMVWGCLKWPMGSLRLNMIWNSHLFHSLFFLPNWMTKGVQLVFHTIWKNIILDEPNLFFF